MEKQEKIFTSGFISKDIPDSVPEYVLGNTSINIKGFVDFLLANEQYAVNGWLNISTKRSKDGKRYSELDLYQYNKEQEKKKQPSTLTSPGVDGEVIDMSDMPF